MVKQFRLNRNQGVAKMSLETTKDAQTEVDQIDVFKRRMLQWNNPVEYVNNMYGCHPDDGKEYFSYVFKKESD